MAHIGAEGMGSAVKIMLKYALILPAGFSNFDITFSNDQIIFDNIFIYVLSEFLSCLGIKCVGRI